MKWCLFLFPWILLATDIPVGDKVIRVPESPTHQMIGRQTRQFSLMESTTPASNRLIYLSAPNEIAMKSNKNIVMDLDDYHLIQSYRQSEFLDLTFEQFHAGKQAMLEGIKQALTPMSMTELEEEVNKTLAEQQFNSAKVKFGNPRLLGDPEITDKWLRFTLLSEIEVDNASILIACQATTTIIKNRLVYIYSYCQYKGSESLPHLNKLHSEFVSGIFSSN